MNKDAMDDKIKERFKTCEKKMHARGSRQIKKLSSKSQPQWIENLSRIY